jgi:hypothetical protein
MSIVLIIERAEAVAVFGPFEREELAQEWCMDPPPVGTRFRVAVMTPLGRNPQIDPKAFQGWYIDHVTGSDLVKGERE